MLNENYDKMMKFLNESQYIVVIVGELLSKECGMPEIRSKKGFFSDINPDKLFNYDNFLENPNFFYSNFCKILDFYENTKTKDIHKFIRNLESLNKIKCTITETFDNTLFDAGIKNIIQTNGNLNEFKCLSCNKIYTKDSPEYNEIYKTMKEGKVPSCNCNNNSVLKPNLFFIGEYARDYHKALTEVQKADMLLVIGTTLKIYPVSTLPGYINDKTKLILLNKVETEYDHRANIIFNDDYDEFARILKFV